ncbi:MAG: PilZ domain-containing protein [Gammaproteobacteria bacterium]|nr:PilZ domain-containing protein [Gammaproteobacteria bacterium]NND39727.1 PilZ domain-containing protein [Pseudomonadales bacterium]MBT8151496.1 PilZ domain-containing protein [Gammaproteobacteria bacterium]NNL11432.1 PilZ domain-containing protein [Pseudomonadales bacterium]NNM11968.1 PilZ domain-containing protein [Pseudomonadales bacterium]
MSNPNLKLVENERAYRRVNVELQGALCMPGSPITMVRTSNISEGGIGLHQESGPLPENGAQVKLQLDGVVSSNADRNFDIYSMKVVYANKNSIGLAFETER